MAGAWTAIIGLHGSSYAGNILYRAIVLEFRKRRHGFSISVAKALTVCIQIIFGDDLDVSDGLRFRSAAA